MRFPDLPPRLPELVWIMLVLTGLVFLLVR